MPAEQTIHSGQPARVPASRLLADFAARRQGGRVRLRDLVDLLDDRAYGLLLLILAVPNIVPNPVPGLSGMLGVPLVLVAAQLMLGFRHPWFPGFLADRSMSAVGFGAIVIKVLPPLTWLERLLHPRLRGLCRPPVEQLLAFFCVILGIVLALPIPLGNTLPALAVSVIALGLVEHDGIAIAVGVVIGAVSLAVVSAVVVALVKALLLILQQAA